MLRSLVVSGATGRMGGAVARLAVEDPDFELLGGIAPDAAEAVSPHFPRIVTSEDAGDLLADADVLIDFSAPPLLAALLEHPAVAGGGTAVVVGTTGLSPDLEHGLDDLSGRAPILQAANFSIGVNLLLALAERAAAVLGPEYDVEIVEAHHRRKEDAPSGTALALGEAVAAGRGIDLQAARKDGRSGRPGPRPEGEIGFHSLRGGDIVGEHQLRFIGDLESIELGHRAFDRALFAAGALRAAHWLTGRDPGRYSI